jgi:hypothetical protein
VSREEREEQLAAAASCARHVGRGGDEFSDFRESEYCCSAHPIANGEAT